MHHSTMSQGNWPSFEGVFSIVQHNGSLTSRLGRPIIRTGRSRKIFGAPAELGIFWRPLMKDDLEAVRDDHRRGVPAGDRRQRTLRFRAESKARPGQVTFAKDVAPFSRSTA